MEVQICMYIFGTKMELWGTSILSLGVKVFEKLSSHISLLTLYNNQWCIPIYIESFYFCVQMPSSSGSLCLDCDFVIRFTCYFVRNVHIFRLLFLRSYISTWGVWVEFFYSSCNQSSVFHFNFWWIFVGLFYILPWGLSVFYGDGTVAQQI